MTSYTDVFGTATLPPAEFGYQALTITADTQLAWSYNSSGTGNTVAKIMDVTCVSGNALLLPDATEVSVGEDFLIRNTGANALAVKDNAGVAVANVAPSAVVYFYLSNNATTGGEFGVVAFGVGASEVDAATLVGYGIKALGTTLNQSHVVTETTSPLTLDGSYRAKLVVFTGGSATFTLPAASTAGNDFFFMLRNSGSGTITLNPDSSQLIDGQLSLDVQPGESLMVVCSGATWYSVGYGRSTLYQFTQLVKDVSAGGTITLTATEAGNKLLTFIGSPSADLTVIVPAVVSVYYVNSNVSTAYNIELKTLTGSGVELVQGARAILLCDGTNVTAAQTVAVSTLASLSDGSSLIPALNFASQTNTGLYKAGSGMGITVLGTSRVVFSDSLTSFQDATNLKLPVMLRDGVSEVNVNLTTE